MSSLLTKEYLLQNGFEVLEFSYGDESVLPSGFNIYKPVTATCLLENKFHRQMFCVVFRGDDIEVWVQVDVGMGFVEIPNGFLETTEDDFAALYSAIRRTPFPNK